MSFILCGGLKCVAQYRQSKNCQILDLSLSSDSSKGQELAGRGRSEYRRRDPRNRKYQRGLMPMAGVELQPGRSQPSTGYPYSENGHPEKKKVLSVHSYD